MIKKVTIRPWKRPSIQTLDQEVKYLDAWKSILRSSSNSETSAEVTK